MAEDPKTILSLTWILGGIATLSFGTRIYTRFIFQKQHGWDDYFMIVAWILAIMSAIFVSMAVHYGLGISINDIEDPMDKMNAVKYLTIAPNPSIMSVALGKISVVLLLHRLMGTTTTKTYSIMLWSMMFISVSLSISAIVVVLRFCTPTESIWDKRIKGECIDPQIQLGIGLSQASFNAFTDLFLALFPSWIFWSLNMTLRRKIGLMMLMGVGVFGAAITSYKAYQLRNLTGHDDLTISWAPITIWNTVEMFVLIVTANIPTLRPLFRSILGLRSTNNASYPLHYTSRKKSSAMGRTTGTGQSLSHSGRDLDTFDDDGRIHDKERGYATSTEGVDNSSVDRILGSSAGDENGLGSGIVKTADFKVTYETPR
ncbi:hypothetical protein FQN54_004394 [Arachnomyces sp. PD_36]|nr:hypothetical protein FQN54_004394 [Arachnomyces sp. PD_36]